MADWVLVPKVATERMVGCAGPAIDDYYNGTKDAPFEGGVETVWQAMLSTAPAYEITEDDVEAGADQMTLGSYGSWEWRKKDARAVLTQFVKGLGGE